MSKDRPSAAAMRAAEHVRAVEYTRVLSENNKARVEEIAAIIDAETGLAELIEALNYIAVEWDTHGSGKFAEEVLARVEAK